MDEYNSMELDVDDAMIIATSIHNKRAVTFSLSYDRISAFVIHINPLFDVIGTMPFGGNPSGKCFVGILYYTSCYLEFNGKGYISPSYIREKFGLSTPDADAISKFFNMVNEQIQ